MNDIASYYPRVPQSLLTNPLDVTVRDTLMAREIVNCIGIKHRTDYNLDGNHMSVIPGGIRYHSVPLPTGTGRLQITKETEKYSVIAYRHHEGIPIPELMMFNLSENEVDEALQLLSK